MKFVFLTCLWALALRACAPASIHGLDFNPDDYVLAQPTCVHRLPLTQFSRAWRQGIRSYTVLNDSQLSEDLNRDAASAEHREAYGYWEDDSIARGSWRGGNVGDTRAAVTPFLAHRHFGETYKWMLYGDDDTLFYMTGVLKLLSSFDPEQPLALTDNIWYYTLHPSPLAPRCLPCGFNISTITTNHSFTPRPACPFCTRALACGTYAPRYRCNATHAEALRRDFGPRLFRLGGQAPGHPDAAPAGDDAGQAAAAAAGDIAAEADESERFRVGMRAAGSAYAEWMSRHAALRAAYPDRYRTKPSMDWEMRDPPEGGQEAEGEGASEPVVDGRRRQRQRRRRRRGRRSLQQESEQSAELQEGRDGGGGSGYSAGIGEGGLGPGLGPGGGARWRRRLAARVPSEQRFVDGGPWLSAALGRNLSADPGAREALRLPHPFCAVHDERLHSRPAPSCLVSISGHGGTGIILSVGLMRLIGAEEALDFITRQRGCGGGDCLLGRLLWFRLGIGFTDPGSALQRGAHRYERFARFIDSNHQMPALITLADPTAALLNPRRGTARLPACDGACVWLIENVVGTHVRAQGRQVNNTVAALQQHLRTHATAYQWVAEARRDPQVAAGNLSIAKWVRARYGGGRGAEEA